MSKNGKLNEMIKYAVASVTRLQRMKDGLNSRQVIRFTVGDEKEAQLHLTQDNKDTYEGMRQLLLKTISDEIDVVRGEIADLIIEDAKERADAVEGE
jgi:hypothetical protein